MSVSKERWSELCRQAAREKDPGKLLQICDEINAILQQASRSSQEGDPKDNSKAATAG
jgi:hypothetical protein